jgi:hypothetical protein
MNTEDPLLVDTGRGLSIFYCGKSLYSSRDPIAGARKIASSMQFEEQTLIFIPSPLLFHGFDDIMEKLPSSCAILCVEADESLSALSLAAAREALKDRRVFYIRTSDPEQAGRYLEKMGAYRFRRTRLLPLNAGYALNKGTYDRILSKLDTVIQTYWRNRMTLMHMGPLWVKNIFINLSELSEAEITYPSRISPLSALRTNLRLGSGRGRIPRVSPSCHEKAEGSVFPFRGRYGSPLPQSERNSSGRHPRHKASTRT